MSTQVRVTTSPIAACGAAVSHQLWKVTEMTILRILNHTAVETSEV